MSRDPQGLSMVLRPRPGSDDHYAPWQEHFENNRDPPRHWRSLSPAESVTLDEAKRRRIRQQDYEEFDDRLKRKTAAATEKCCMSLAWALCKYFRFI